VALGSLNEIMKLPVDRPDDTRFVNRRVEKGDIECRGVSFSYPGSNVPALRDFSVRIKAGEREGHGPCGHQRGGQPRDRPRRQDRAPQQVRHAVLPRHQLSVTVRAGGPARAGAGYRSLSRR
jgi:hypothetical protein